MKFSKLTELSGLPGNYSGLDDKVITGVTEHSSNVKEGSIFVAIKGYETDGHAYIQDAVNKGAAVIVGETADLRLDVPYIQVKNGRKWLARLAAAFHEFPSKRQRIIGITGTNGKTTTAFFLRHLLQEQGYTVSFFGTVLNEVNGKELKTANTTPNASLLQEKLAESKDDFVILEVSSQGLDQYRLEGVEFDYALFTNLQKDHLTYHGSMENYFKAKEKLFHQLKPNGKAIINYDDSWGKKLAGTLEEEKKIETLLIGQSKQADVKLQVLNAENGIIYTEKESVSIQNPMPGAHNLYNLTMAATVLQDIGISLEDISRDILRIQGVPGRFEVYSFPNDVRVIVDYAHTTEAVQVLLETIHTLDPEADISHIFGFRAKRDAFKWKEMLKESANWCHRVYLTTDDLHETDVEELRRTYEKFHAVYPDNLLFVEMDRTLAIKQAVQKATGGSWVVITGKGHETYRETFEFPTRSDKETVQYLQKQLVELSELEG